MKLLGLVSGRFFRADADWNWPIVFISRSQSLPTYAFSRVVELAPLRGKPRAEVGRNGPKMKPS